MDIAISNEMLKEAIKLSNEIGSLRNSIRKGKGNQAGMLGELAVASLENFERKSTYDYDVVSADGRTFDVKTKARTVRARPDYNATVADFNTKQRCDGYIFVSIFGETVQIMGWLPKEEFYEQASFFEKGDADPSDQTGRGWTFRADCYNLKYGSLNRMESIHE